METPDQTNEAENDSSQNVAIPAEPAAETNSNTAENANATISTENQRAAVEGVSDAVGGLSSENTERYNSLSAAAQVIYDGLMRIPGINVKIAEHVMGGKKNSLREWNRKTQELGISIDDLDKDISAARAEVAEREARGNDGSLRGKINALKLERKRMKIEDWESKKVKLSAEAEISTRNAQRYETERNRIADWLIERHDEKMLPLEERVVDAEADMANFRTEHAADFERLEILKNQANELYSQRAGIVKTARASGLSLAMVSEQIAYCDEQIKSVSGELQRMNGLATEQIYIQERIARAKNELKRRDKRPSLIKAKNEKAKLLTPQGQNAEALAAQDSGAAQETINAETGQQPVAETEQNVENREYGIVDLMESWNDFITQKLGSGNERMTVSMGQLRNRLNLPEDGIVDMARFQEAVRGRYANLMTKGEWLRNTISEAIDEFPGHFSDRNSNPG